jgi:hypothetical protein
VPWSQPLYYQSIQLGDLDGDGNDELVGRDAFGVHVYYFDETQGTWLPMLDATGKLELVRRCRTQRASAARQPRISSQEWECVTDAQGKLQMLRPAGRPTKDVILAQ